MERQCTQILLLGITERASLTSIVTTAEPGSPTNFAPISFSAWNSVHHRPGKQQEQAEASRSRQKPSEASKNQQQLPQRQQEESSKSKNGAAEAPVHNLNAHLALTCIELSDGKSPDWT